MNKELTKSRKVSVGKTTRKTVQVINNKILIDKHTGEEFSTQEVIVEERDANFNKIWLGHILLALDTVGNKKIKVMMWIVSNRNRDNMIIGTQREIAKKCEVSVPVVNEAINLLIDIDFMVKGEIQGVYIINPNAIFEGGKSNRMNILFKYEETRSVKQTQINDDPKTWIETQRKQIERRTELEKGDIISSKKKKEELLDAKIKALQDMKENLDND